MIDAACSFCDFAATTYPHLYARCLAFCACSNKNKEGNGGAIRTEIKTDIFVENSRFMSNQANVVGGAIYNKGKLDVHNSTFEGNAATMVRASTVHV